MNKVKAHDKQLSDLAVKVEDVSGIEKRVSAQIEDVRKKVEDAPFIYVKPFFL